MNRSRTERSWLCLPRMLLAEVEAVRCFGRHESERAAAAILKVLQAAGQWLPFQFDDVARVCHGDKMTLLGLEHLREAGFINETEKGFVVSAEFIERIFQAQSD